MENSSNIWSFSKPHHIGAIEKIQGRFLEILTISRGRNFCELRIFIWYSLERFSSDSLHSVNSGLYDSLSILEILKWKQDCLQAIINCLTGELGTKMFIEILPLWEYTWMNYAYTDVYSCRLKTIKSYLTWCI